MGDLQVVYDDDVNGNRIRMTKDNGALICNHIICKDYQLQWYVSLLCMVRRRLAQGTNLV